MGRLRIAVVCSSNVNRSVAAHELLQREGLQVESFGVGQRVKLPGESAAAPNVFEFGTPYSEMAAALRAKAEAFYTRKGLLGMLERNARVKPAPQRWQAAEPDEFDVAITFEERIFDQLLDETQGRRQHSTQPLLVVNMDVVDNHEEAAAAAPLVLKLCRMMEAAPELLPAADGILKSFQQVTGRRLLHDVCFN